MFQIELVHFFQKIKKKDKKIFKWTLSHKAVLMLWIFCGDAIQDVGIKWRWLKTFYSLPTPLYIGRSNKQYCLNLLTSFMPLHDTVYMKS